MEEAEPDKVWDELSDKEYRLTMIEEGLEKGRSEVEPTPACGVGDTEDADGELRVKIASLENTVRTMPEGRRPAQERTPISETRRLGVDRRQTDIARVE